MVKILLRSERCYYSWQFESKMTFSRHGDQVKHTDVVQNDTVLLTGLANFGEYCCHAVQHNFSSRLVSTNVNVHLCKTIILLL
jgi:hypothetical protein